MIEKLDIKTITLHVERFVASAYIDSYPFSTMPKVAVDEVARRAAYLIRALQDVAVQRECVAEYPADWWQALKLRFAPAWFLKRWPAVMSRIDMMALYPRIAIPKMNPVVRIAQWTPTSYLPSYTEPAPKPEPATHVTQHTVDFLLAALPRWKEKLERHNYRDEAERAEYVYRMIG